MAKLKFGDTGSCPAMYESIDYVGIPREVSNQGFYGIPTNSFSFVLSKNATNISNKALYTAFQECTTLTSVDLSSLTGISGEYSLYHAFTDCTNLTSIDLSSLTTVSGQYALYWACRGCTKLSNINLSSLSTISGSNSMGTSFAGCTSLTNVDLSSLATVSGGGAVNGLFANCTNLTNVDLSSLRSISGSQVFLSTFSGCTSLTNISFPSLSSISGSCAMQNTFENCTSLQNVYFPAITSNTFINNPSSMANILQGCSNVTLHFPIDTRSTIESNAYFANGQSGTNTKILFDLGACETTFSITPSNNIIFANSELVNNNIGYYEKQSTITYSVANSIYGFYIDNYTIPNTDSTTISLDLTNINFNLITLNIGVSGLTVVAEMNNSTCNFTETSNGIYTLNIYNNTSNDITVNYTVYGGSSYMDVTDSLTFIHSDISENITMTPATESQFVRPNLTSNGTLGGNSFAVSASSEMIEEPAFYAVDNDVNSTCTVEFIEGGDPNTWLKYTFYNPVALKTTAIGLKLYNIPNTPSLTFKASDDNINWTALTVTNTDTSTDYVISTLDNTTAYKYYKITLKPANEWDDYDDCGISDITITATQKVPTV